MGPPPPPPKGEAGMTVPGGGAVAIRYLVGWVGHVRMGLRVSAEVWIDGLVAEGFVCGWVQGL